MSMPIKNFLAFMLVALLAVAIFAPSFNGDQVAATVYPATSAAYTADGSSVLEHIPHLPSSGGTLNTDMKVLVEVAILAAIGMLAGAVLRRWSHTEE